MNNIRLHRHPLLSLVLIMVILTGCAGSPSAKFYQLSPLQSVNHPTAADTLEQKVSIAIGPVRIPEYLDRPQIVTRSDGNEVRVSEFNRWAGSLEADVARVLIEDIAILLPPDRFLFVPWTSYQENREPGSYRVEVFVDRFEGAPGDVVILKARWEVLDSDRRSLFKNRSWIRESVEGENYDAVVAAMSHAVERLSRDIAGGIVSTFK